MPHRPMILFDTVYYISQKYLAFLHPNFVDIQTSVFACVYGRKCREVNLEHILRGELHNFFPEGDVFLKDNWSDHLPVDMTSRLLSSLC